MTRARDLANIADGTFTATDLDLSGTLTVSGDANFDSGSLFVDVSANAVGIGTTSPQGILEVVDTNPILQIRDSQTSAGSATATIRMGESGLSGIENYWDIKVNGSDGALQFIDNWSGGAGTGTRMVISDGGSVGIGTNDPASYSFNTGIETVIKGTANSQLSLISDTTGIGYLAFGDGTTGTDRYRGLLEYYHSDDSLRVRTAGSEAMRIDSSGNVGIGTTTPYTVNGGASIDGETSAGFEFIAGNSLTGTTGGEFIGAYLFRNSDGSGTPLHYAGMWADAADSFGFMDLHFSAGRDVYEAGSSHMTIKDDGNVGIGTVNPAKPLQVSQGANNTATTIRIENTDTSIETAQDVNTIEFYTNDSSASGTGVTSEISQVAINAGNQYALTFSTYNASLSEKMRIDHDGNVGLLTGSPLSRLHVNGGDSNNIRYQGATHIVAMGMTGADPFVGTVSNAPLLFLTNGSEKAQLDTSGNLKVGTTNITTDPGVQLLAAGGIYSHLAGTGGADSMRFYRNSVEVGSITTTGTTTTYNTSSDARLKENIADAEDASSFVDAIKVRQFDWKADGSHQRYGMVAQELMTVAPEAVSGDPESDDMMGVDYSKLVPMLVKEIQSLRARVAQLEGA